MGESQVVWQLSPSSPLLPDPGEHVCTHTHTCWLTDSGSATPYPWLRHHGTTTLVKPTPTLTTTCITEGN